MKVFKTYIPTNKIKKLRILEFSTFMIAILVLLIDGGKRSEGLIEIVPMPQWFSSESILWISSISKFVYIYCLVFYIMSMIWKEDEKSNNAIEIGSQFIQIKKEKYSVEDIDTVLLSYPENVNKGKASLYKNFLSFYAKGKEIKTMFALEKEELWRFFEFLRHRDKKKFLIELLNKKTI